MPHIGEIKKDYEIGCGNKRDNLIWLACKECGKERWVRVTDTRKVDYTGKCKYCCIHGRDWKLEKSPHWEGGIKHSGGRVYIYVPTDSPYRPMADVVGYVLEHRLIMARHLGRCLTKKEIVHHEDENMQHNDISNLRLFQSTAEHISYHRRKEISEKGKRPVNLLGQFLKGGYRYANQGN